MSGLPEISGRVLVIGDVMDDIIVLPEGEMVPGSDVRAQIRMRPGGSGANQAMWLAALGVPVTFLARIGAADLERQAARFKARGVEPVFVADDDLPTGRLVTLVDAKGERSFFTDRAANTRLSPEDCPDRLMDGVGLVHLSGYAFFEPGPRATALHVMALARARGVPVSIDPASTGFLAEVGAAQFIEWTDGADLFFPNAEEALLLTEKDERDEQVRALGASYNLVVVKCGADGAVVGDRDGIVVHAPAPRINAVDTTGAGDAFFAGFIDAVRSGGRLEACLEAGNRAGAQAAGRIGGQPD